MLSAARMAFRISDAMFAFLACIALTLASVGLFAVTAHSVAQRTHEIGVRSPSAHKGDTSSGWSCAVNSDVWRQGSRSALVARFWSGDYFPTIS
jgi:hypothetical protein